VPLVTWVASTSPATAMHPRRRLRRSSLQEQPAHRMQPPLPLRQLISFLAVQSQLLLRSSRLLQTLSRLLLQWQNRKRACCGQAPAPSQLQQRQWIHPSHCQGRRRQIWAQQQQRGQQQQQRQAPAPAATQVVALVGPPAARRHTPSRMVPVASGSGVWSRRPAPQPVTPSRAAAAVQHASPESLQQVRNALCSRLVT
jgi:hypothetical protein